MKSINQFKAFVFFCRLIIGLIIIWLFLILTGCKKEPVEPLQNVTYTVYSKKGSINFSYPDDNGKWIKILSNQNSIVINAKQSEKNFNLSPTVIGFGIDSVNLKIDMNGKQVQQYVVSNCQCDFKVFCNYYQLK